MGNSRQCFVRPVAELNGKNGGGKFSVEKSGDVCAREAAKRQSIGGQHPGALQARVLPRHRAAPGTIPRPAALDRVQIQTFNFVFPPF